MTTTQHTDLRPESKLIDAYSYGIECRVAKRLSAKIAAEVAMQRGGRESQIAFLDGYYDRNRAAWDTRIDAYSAIVGDVQ